MQSLTVNVYELDELFHRVRHAIEERDAPELRHLSEEITRRFTPNEE